MPARDLTKVPKVSRGKRGTPTAQYMRPERTGILSMRRAPVRDIKRDVHQSATRAFGLALDFLQNNGWIAGAADQIITDTIGAELRLNMRPDLVALGYDDEERQTFCRLVESEWRRWANNAVECDLEGKATLSEMLDGAMRYYLSAGEGIAIIDYLAPRDRARYGITTGTKVRLAAPHRLTRHTNLLDGWEQGIYHDEIGRPGAYRFRQTIGGLDQDVDVPARTGDIARVIMAMDRGATPNSPRGICPMTPAFKVMAQSDQLADATLTTALLQTAFAATITSPEPSDIAFQALEQIEAMDFDGAEDLAADLFEVWGQRIDALKSKALSIGGDASQVNHLGPGEKLDLHSSATPGPQYVPFQQNMSREIARCLGVTFETLTMDHSNATYSSTRMSIASIWPIVLRRRSRIAAPIAQGVFEAWLDEMIGTGRIPFKGGYAAFRANRGKVCQADWRGPAKPSADPHKDAMANKVALETGSTTLQTIAAERGGDWEEDVDQAAREAARMREAGLTPPHGRMSGGNGAGPDGAAADGLREESKDA